MPISFEDLLSLSVSGTRRAGHLRCQFLGLKSATAERPAPETSGVLQGWWRRHLGILRRVSCCRPVCAKPSRAHSCSAIRAMENKAVVFDCYIFHSLPPSISLCPVLSPWATKAFHNEEPTVAQWREAVSIIKEKVKGIASQCGTSWYFGSDPFLFLFLS